MFDIGKRSSAPRREETGHAPEQDFTATATPQTAAASVPAAGRRSEPAVIGASIHIDGNLRGEEDLVIDGEVSGTVELKSNGLTIGKHGRVKADVYAHTLRVEGSVEGNLYASELVAIHNSAQVKGNVVSPRVNLEDGARFKGSIEMDPEAVESALGLANQKGTTVALSYRGDAFQRIAERNREKIERAIASGKVTPYFNSQIQEIRDDVAVLTHEGQSRILPADYVVVRIGGEAPYAFLERLGIRIVEKDVPIPQSQARAG